VEADRSVMALCRELHAATVFVLVRGMWGWCFAYGQLDSADRCVLSAVTGQPVENHRVVCSQGLAIRTVWK